MIGIQVKRMVVIGLAIALVALAVSIPAAPPARAQQTLSFGDLTVVQGTLDAATPEAVYTADCFTGGVGSVYVETTAGNLETTIAVQSATGQPIAAGGVIAHNPNISVAEAFVMPPGTGCSIRLSAAAGTSGSYVLRLQPGYAEVAVSDPFDGMGGPLALEWEPYTSDTMEVHIVGQQLQIQVFTENLIGWVTPSATAPAWTDLYIQADVQVDTSASYYEYGFLLDTDEDAETFYNLSFSSDSDWSLYYFSGEWNEVQPWTVSAAVNGADPQPRIAVWHHGDTFEVYFNNEFVGSVTDATGFADEGTIALAAATTADQADMVTVSFDNLVITQPYPVPGTTTLPFGGEDATQVTPTPGNLAGIFGLNKPTATPAAPAMTPTTGFVFATPTTGFVFATPTTSFVIPTPASQSRFPQTLSNFASGRPQDIVNELQQAGAVPPGGTLSLNVPSSFGDTSAEGWSFYPLGQGRTFRNFVLAFDARLVYGGSEAGCGMYFRSSDTANYDAVIMEDGWGLLGEWDSGGNLTDFSVYEESPAVVPGIGSTNKVIVVANEATVLMYVNGQLFGDSQFTPASGGLALEMYVPTNDAGGTDQTYCQLNNIWLWEF